MNYYLVSEKGLRPQPLVRDGYLWYWGESRRHRRQLSEIHLRSSHQIVAAECAADTGYALHNVSEHCGRGVLTEEGHFFGCENVGHDRLIPELLDYYGVDRDHAKNNWVGVYEDKLLSLKGGSDFQNRVDRDGYRLNEAQDSILERLGFDVSSYKRDWKAVPTYEDVFSDDQPAYPPRECTARIVEDVQEVKDWMQQQEATFTDAPSW